jgi:ABC-type multidrug transport system fused ATPase/permease subunit
VSPRSTFSRWPGAVSYVPQDSPVINGTIRENLGLGYQATEINEEFCWESLRIARLDNFVKNLPNQLDTYVGDRGTRLSGGQRQRLGIARALITKPKLLILDEATSSLDGITESEISDALRRLKGEVTLIVIAHRLSTVVNADRIYFMHDGIVKGVGNFEELKRAHSDFLTQAELMGL